MGKFELTLSENYVSNWKMSDAIRELIQNAIDQEEASKAPFSVAYDVKKQQLVISNAVGHLTTDTLLLGNGTKADSVEFIGEFGEGYKLALLVLTRIKKPVRVYLAKSCEVWTTRFVKSRRYGGANVLTIDTNKYDPKQAPSEIAGQDVSFVIQGVSEEDFHTTVESIALSFDPIYKESETYEFNESRVLLNPAFAGRIYISGLYVATIPEFIYGYNLRSGLIQYSRDRNFSDTWSTSFYASQLWANNINKKEFRDMMGMASRPKDIGTLSHFDNTLHKRFAEGDIFVANQIYADLVVKYGKVVFTDSYAKIASLKLTYVDVEVHVISDELMTFVDKSDDYAAFLAGLQVRDLSLMEELDIWLSTYCLYLDSSSIDELRLLFVKALETEVEEDEN